MFTVLIQWLVLVIIVCLLYWVLAQFAPAPIMKVVLVVCVVVVVLSLIWLILPMLHLNGVGVHSMRPTLWTRLLI